MNPQNPLIINSDFTILLEVKSPHFAEARNRISAFLELVKSPELFYTYRLDEISIWNGFSLGLTAHSILRTFETFSKFPVPDTVKSFVEEQWRHYGLIKLLPLSEASLEISSEDEGLLKSLRKTKEVGMMITYQAELKKYVLPRALQGVFKMEMIKLGFPVEDRVGFVDGDPHPITLHEGKNFSVRDYQQNSLDAYFGGENSIGGAGVIVLPCGAGKTVVGIMAMARLGMKTLIIAPNIVALRQWKSELIAKTSAKEEDIGEYSGETKNIKPITLATYQILVYRQKKDEAFKHLSLFSDENWGLIIYDEIHLLPAPVFRAIASIQAKRRLGLTATLVREDNLERDVFALIGPKKFDMPWKELESKKFIAEAVCFEVRAPMDEELMAEYFRRSEKNQYRIAAENPSKEIIIENIMARMPDHQVLIIGQYLDQLDKIAFKFKIPLITGATSNEDRLVLFKQFREGKIRKLIVSKVANFAIDLPDADVAIQISGTFGSRQEEAQRLGRILRAKPGHNRAYFFSIVSADTREEVYAQNRKRFLMEQGYEYQVLKAEDILDSELDLNSGFKLEGNLSEDLVKEKKTKQEAML